MHCCLAYVSNCRFWCLVLFSCNCHPSSTAAHPSAASCAARAPASISQQHRAQTEHQQQQLSSSAAERVRTAALAAAACAGAVPERRGSPHLDRLPRHQERGEHVAHVGHHLLGQPPVHAGVPGDRRVVELHDGRLACRQTSSAQSGRSAPPRNPLPPNRHCQT